MRVLVIGSGGREHALCTAILKSPLLTKLWCAPGNPGIESDDVECVNITKLTDLVNFAVEQKVDLVIPGPEAIIGQGITDEMEANGIACCAPSKIASQLETSKEYTKQLCDAANIPTSSWKSFTVTSDAVSYIAAGNIPVVVKADGLAAGKGVYVCKTYRSAVDAIKILMVDKMYGESGNKIIVEECLLGTEASVFALCNGNEAILFGTAQDHKRLLDGDNGPNTGGMGAISPAPAVNEIVLRQTWQDIILPALEEMKKRGSPFKGILFAGIMIEDNSPKLIEFNVRFGDPECQAMLLRLESDLLKLLYSAATGVSFTNLKLSSDIAVSVVMASPGYPEKPQTGDKIDLPPVKYDWLGDIYHSGTAMKNNQLVSSGGRVLTVCGKGASLPEARQIAYSTISFVDWPNAQYRKDIGNV